jgi:hypothetical protein
METSLKGPSRWLVCSGVLLAVVISGLSEVLNPVYRTVVPGLDYAHIQGTNSLNNEPLSIHVARLDRSTRDLHLASVLAHNQVFGTAPVSSIVQSASPDLGLPLAAVNTGFCVNKLNPYLGMPRGIVITEGQLITKPDKYSFWMDTDGAMHFAKIEAKFTATLPGQAPVALGLNQECSSNSVVLYTHMLGKSTRATNSFELLLESENREALFWRAGRECSLVVSGLNPAGNFDLSNTVAVLAFGQDRADLAAGMKPGDKVKVALTTLPDISNAVTACQGIFPVAREGRVLEEFESSPYMLKKHPRTAIGFGPKFFFVVVVDGRKKELSTGMHPHELGRLMVDLGCAEAMNMDGGGSSTFWLDGMTRNSVAGSRERSRSDILLILQRPGSNAE